MSPADPRRNPRSNLADLVRTAQDAYRERDYEQVIQLLEGIPENKLSDRLADLLELCRERAEEVERLKADIEDALGRERFGELREHLERLLELKSGSKRYRQMLDTMNSVRHGHYRVRLHKDGTRSIDVVGSDFSWAPVAIGVAVLAVVCTAGYFGVQWYLQRPTSQLLVRTDDPALEIRVDGETWTWTGTEAVRDVPAGPHAVDALLGDEIVDHRTVRSTAGKRVVLTFETAGGTLLVQEVQEDLAVAVAEAVPVETPLATAVPTTPEQPPVPVTPVVPAQPTPRTDEPPTSMAPKSTVLAVPRPRMAVPRVRLPGSATVLIEQSGPEGIPDLPRQTLRVRGPLASGRIGGPTAEFVMSPKGDRIATRDFNGKLVRFYDALTLAENRVVEFPGEVHRASFDWDRDYVVFQSKISGQLLLSGLSLSGSGAAAEPRVLGTTFFEGSDRSLHSQFSPDGSRVYARVNEQRITSARADGTAVEELPQMSVPPGAVKYRLATGNEWIAATYSEAAGPGRSLGVRTWSLPQLDDGWMRTVVRKGVGNGKANNVLQPSRDGSEVGGIWSYDDAGAPDGLRSRLVWMHRDGRAVTHDIVGLRYSYAMKAFLSDDARRVVTSTDNEKRIVMYETWSGRKLFEFTPPGGLPTVVGASTDLSRLAIRTYRQVPGFSTSAYFLDVYAVEPQ